MKLTFTITLALIAQISFGQKRIQSIDSLISAIHTNGKFNGNILIAEKGEIIYKKSFGYANEEQKIKLDENSIFELASVSKQFTAMAIMILKEKGKLKLDDDISKYIPELKNYKGITVRNLVHHTGGLPDYMKLMDSVFDKSKIATNKDIVAVFAKHQPKVLFEPNSKYEYSNTGYALLATIIEKASKQSFANFLQKTIFDPLKMSNTFVYTRRYAPKKVDNYAFGYIYSDSLKKYILPDELEDTKMVIWLDGIVGDGCVNSNLKDLLLWDRALYTNKLLSKEGMNELFEGATLSDSSKTKYGFGWFIDDNADFGEIVSHSGGWPGYVSYVERNTTNDKTIIMLQNHDNVSIPSKSIRALLYNKPIPKPTVRKETTLTQDQLMQLVGIYELEKDFEMKISIEKDQLFAQLTGQNSFPIFPENELFFFLKVVDAQLQFEKNETGEIVKLFLLQNGNKIEAKKIK